MSAGAHRDLGELGPELRKLAQAILDRLDPAVRAAAMLAAADAPGKCQQVWCPVCALAALVTGEEHPLLSVVAEHSVALFDVIRAVVGETGDRPGPPDGPPPGGDGDAPAKTGYQHIPVTIEH
ncbi:hypothetical protein [Mycolicibacter senuensis]|uniref:Uncharacterized protein n=1 Tax=Mycolicibacter senuensis TaxID=386913 RepID=A0A7I9XJZ4_9MYCO|nr:hypothetical protein [Mycolicibacter senuensis]MDQ2628314.1 hypothetical protein [Actinomycetota bacterium]ORW68596.1 hypothetical protein AWC24_07105 [Mycolicibacter senuensis]GFG69840.1 hypothetical protein MSEN_15600 [Mycolicibacter senuensis]